VARVKEHIKIYSGSGHRSVIPIVNFFYIATTRAWSIEFMKDNEFVY
jgi:hypothetical protein